VAACLELGGKPAVDDDVAALEQLAEATHETSVDGGCIGWPGFL